MAFEREIRAVCPVGGGGDTFLLVHKDGRIVKESFEIKRCRTCDAIYVGNPIHSKHLPEVYKWLDLGCALSNTID